MMLQPSSLDFAPGLQQLADRIRVTGGMKDTVHDHGFGFDGVEHAERKTGSEDATKKSKLHRTRFGKPGDEGEGGIDTADEIKRGAWAMIFVPEARLG